MFSHKIINKTGSVLHSIAILFLYCIWGGGYCWCEMFTDLISIVCQVTELTANVPDPTQDQDTRTCSDSNTLEGELPALKVNTSETERLSDIFGLDLRREGGQYKLTPHDPNASLTELLTSPILVPDVSATTSAERQHNTQVSPSLLFVKKK